MYVFISCGITRPLFPSQGVLGLNKEQGKHSLPSNGSHQKHVSGKNPLRLPVGSFLFDTILFNGVIQ